MSKYKLILDKILIFILGITLVTNCSKKDDDNDLLLFLLLSQPNNPRAFEVPRFMYVASWGTNEIFQYGINASNGRTNLLDVIPSQTNPTALTINEDGTFLFSASPNANRITSYSIDRESGRLELLGSFATAATLNQGILPQDIQIDPTGRFLYTANQGDDTISAFSIDTTGNLTALTGSPTNAREVPTQSVLLNSLRIHPTGRFLYSVNLLGKNIGIFNLEVDGANAGQISATPTFEQVFQDDPDNSAPGDLAIEPSGRFLYVVDRKGGVLRFWRINQTDGTLAVVPSESNVFENPLVLSQNETNSNPFAVRVDPTGRFLYVLNYNSKTISLFTIDPFRGFVRFVNSQRTGNNPKGLYVDKSGRFVFVANSGSNTVGIYRVETANGRLKLIREVSVGSDPRFVISY